MSQKWEDEHLLSICIKRNGVERLRGDYTPSRKQEVASWVTLLVQGRLSPLQSGSRLPSAAAAVSVILLHFILQGGKKKQLNTLLPF